MIPASFWRALAIAEIEPAQQKMYAENAQIAEKHEVAEAKKAEDDIGMRHAALMIATGAHPGESSDFIVEAADTYLRFLKGESLHT